MIMEQQEIVRRVDSLFTLADQIEARRSAARRQVDTLTPSLLPRAFTGKLVPQDPQRPTAVRIAGTGFRETGVENDYR